MTQTVKLIAFPGAPNLPIFVAQENGWFANNCLTRPEAPLLHTIGYALQGVLEVGILSGEKRFVDAARKGTVPLLPLISPKCAIRIR